MRFHTIGGLPRSGSTLLCNLLNQNPGFYASSTSVLPQTLTAMKNGWSNSPEIKSDLADSREEIETRLSNCMRAVVHTWYADKLENGVAFDKSRAWN